MMPTTPRANRPPGWCRVLLAAWAPALAAGPGTAQEAAPPKPAPIRSLACSADGSLLATATEAAIAIRRRPGGETVRDLALPSAPLQVAFAPAGALLAAACADGAVRVFDLAGGKGSRTLFCGATSLAFPADGSLLVGDRAGRVTAVPAAMLAPGPGDSVDLRINYERWQLPPRRQGHRGTCSVFTAAAAYEYALCQRQDRGVAVSEEFLNWAANDATGRVDDGSFFHDVVAGFAKYGVCRADLMPYQDQFDPGLKPSAQALADAAAVRDSGLCVRWINPWQPQAGLAAEHFAALRQVLDRGLPVCLGSSHSTLAVGYADDPAEPGGGSIVIRDSATGGYRALSYEHVRQQVGDVFWVDPAGAGN